MPKYLLDVESGDVIAEDILAVDNIPPFRASIMVSNISINIKCIGWLCNMQRA
jgi:hypothetical protein